MLCHYKGSLLREASSDTLAASQARCRTSRWAAPLKRQCQQKAGEVLGGCVGRNKTEEANHAAGDLLVTLGPWMLDHGSARAARRPALPGHRARHLTRIRGPGGVRGITGQLPRPGRRACRDCPRNTKGRGAHVERLRPCSFPRLRIHCRLPFAAPSAAPATRSRPSP